MIIRFWLTGTGTGPVPTKHQGSAPVQLVRGPGPGRWVARALEGHVHRIGHHARREEAPAKPRAGRSALLRRPWPADGGGSDGSLTVMSRTPRAHRTDTISSPMGPAPVTRTRSSGRTPASSTAWTAIAVGSASAASRRPSESGITRVLGRGHRHVPGEGSPHVPDVGGLPAEADRGTATTTRPAGPAARGRIGDHPGPGGRSGSRSRPATTVPDHSWPEDGPRPGVLLEDQVEVGSADPACGHLDQQLTRRGSGTGTWSTSIRPSPR